MMLREGYFEPVEEMREAADIEIADAELKATLDEMEAAHSLARSRNRMPKPAPTAPSKRPVRRDDRPAE